MKLAAEHLDKSFDTNHVLDDVSFEVSSGSALGLLGRNGAGKTTTIRIIMQVFPANSGKVLLDGVPMDIRKVRVGYMPEERGLYPKKKVLDQLVYFAALRGMGESAARESAMRLLERTDMEEYAQKKLETLSKGNQQKIQLVSTLVHDPDIVILDEPFSGLDPVNAMLLKDLVRELIGQGKIVLFSSHQMNYVEEFCKTIAIINCGRIVLNGDIATIKRGYDRRNIRIVCRDAIHVNAYIHEHLLSRVTRTEADGQELSVSLTAESDKHELLQALAAQQFDIDRFEVFEPSLGDIFVEYTEESV